MRTSREIIVVSWLTEALRVFFNREMTKEQIHSGHAGYASNFNWDSLPTISYPAIVGYDMYIPSRTFLRVAPWKCCALPGKTKFIMIYKPLESTSGWWQIMQVNGNSLR
jgi:hypothetical protein